PAAVDHLVVIALIRRHGIDDGLDPRDLLVVHLVGHVLHSGEWPYRGKHLHDALQRSQFLDLAQLIAEVFEREAVATERLLGDFFWSSFSCAFSIKDRTSPMPRMRPTMRSGWNGSNASYFSPTPMNLIGCPVTFRIESAAPPRASPSIFVRTTPVRLSFL